MKLARMVSVFFVMFSVAACSDVYIEEPIGTEVVQVEEDDWEGIWVVDGEPLIVGVRDRDAGILWVAGVEEREGEPTLKSMAVHVRRSPYLGDGQFLISMEDDDRYVWFLAIETEDEDSLVVYAPNAARFRALIEEGKLPGPAVEGKSGGDVYLGRLEPEHLETIFADDSGTFFVWQEPYIFRRVAR